MKRVTRGRGRRPAGHSGIRLMWTGLAMLALMLVVAPGLVAQETILFTTDFESDNGGFTHTGVVDEWEWGTPLFGDGVTPHSGSRVWATDLDGRLDFNHDGSLHAPEITLPSITQTQRIYVSFYCLTKIDCMSDRATLYVSSDNANWEEIADLFNTMEMGVDEFGTPLETGNADWHKYEFDVSDYAGGPIYLRFHAAEPEGGDYWYGCPIHDMAGVYIDDVAVKLIDGVSHTVKFTMEGWEDPADYASCPWVSFWDGDEWVKENDIYSTARYPGNEFRDYLSLEKGQMVDDGGYYRLRVSELEEEHSYTDWLSLVVVDHPAGTNVGCDDAGNVYTYSNPLAPAQATDQTGADVLADLVATDGAAFAGYDEYYIDLDFSNVDVTGPAKLVLDMTGFVLDPTLPPEPIPPYARRGLSIQTRDAGGAWVERGYFNPRFMASTKVFDLAPYLPGGDGGSDVRLVFVSCHVNKYHTLDFVGLDTSPDAAMEVQALLPVEAEHTTQGDVLDLLGDADNDYVLMNPGEEIQLSFAVPSQALDERSFVFVSEGYYVPGANTYFFFTWDGSSWVLRDGKSYNAGYNVDQTNEFDLSLFLPDPDGEYKVMIWQDYRYEPAEMDYVGMTANGNVGTLEYAHCFQWQNNRDVLTELAASDDFPLTFTAWQMNGRTRVVHVRFTDLPLCESVPVVQNLDIGGDENIYQITDPTPEITWDMFDADGDLQEEFAVQVWTGPGATGDNLWNYSEESSATSIEYAGDPLIPGNYYYLRLRVRDDETANCWSSWSEVVFRMYCEDCVPPTIVRTPATLDLSSSSQPAGSPLTIEAWITDNTGVDEARLYYRPTSTADYTWVVMDNPSDSLYSAVIPAAVVDQPGMDYYIWASDGASATTSPMTNPAAGPHQIPVTPNVAPVIAHTPITSSPCGTGIAVTASVTDATNYVDEVKLHYRMPGEFVYGISTMTPAGGNSYQATIPSDYTVGTSVEYYISATDDFGVTSYSGSFDDPHVISLTGTCNEPPEAESLTVAPGDPCNVTDFTPTFGWTYVDVEGQPQSHYEVEVWSGADGTGAMLWNPAAFAGDAASIEYTGAALQDDNCYFFRVRVKDGLLWSEWSELRFCFGELVLTPALDTVYVGDTATFTASGGPQPYSFDLSNWDVGTIVENATTVDFIATAAGTTLIGVMDDCGSMAESEIVVVEEGGTGLTPTNEWINIYCGEPTVNGVPLVPGDVITAYDPDGVLCGIDTVRADGAFGFMPVYAEEPYNSGDQGAEPGDVITFMVNDVEYTTDPEVIWTSHGDMFEVCEFISCQPFDLDAGWHLISWNRQYSGSIDDFLAIMGIGAECVEVILSFDGGGLTYDPDMIEYSTLLDVDYHFGYWIKLNCAVEFDVCGGRIDVDDGIALAQYWNVVSYWPQDSLPVADALAGIYDDLMVAIGFNGAGLVHVPGEAAFNTLNDMGPGFGYWLKVESPGTLLYPGWTGSGVPLARMAPTPDIEPSRTWMSLYGSNLTLDGEPLTSGVIEVYGEDGSRCGRGLASNGKLNFTPVYGHDEASEVTAAYPKAGDKLTITVDGTPVANDVVWTGFGDRVALSALATSGGPVVKPATHSLHQNYPNPFNPVTTIAFESAEATDYRLTVYNTLGQIVKRFEGTARQGENEVTWDASSNSSGIYFYKLEIGSFSDTKKMMLLK